jgi:putative FmdB family regulatory protein
MPIYEYKCKSCGREEELLVSLSEADGQQCPGCGKALERIMSAHGVGRSSGGNSGGESPCGGGSCAGGTCPYS